MPLIDSLTTQEIIRLRYNLDIPAFVRAAVRRNLSKAKVLVYLDVITHSHKATEKMRQFVPVAKEKGLRREEILVWLHLSYGGVLDSAHLSRKLSIPPHSAEKALAVLREKGIIGERRVL